jgi:hypothetical protein
MEKIECRVALYCWYTSKSSKNIKMSNKSNQIMTFAQWVDSQCGAPLTLDEMLSLRIITKRVYNKLKKEQAAKDAKIEAIKNECLWRIVNMPFEEVQEELKVLDEMAVDVDTYVMSLVA